MRIDHDKCGSKVDQETLTVKTFITVQENLGIFTHSTRRYMLRILNEIIYNNKTKFSYRFVVVCTYQPDTLTVRASFSVPGKAGVAAVQPHWDSDRSGRDRKFRMVNKSALILKEETSDVDVNSSQENDSVNSVANIKEVTIQPNGRESDNIMDNLVGGNDQRLVSKYDRLVNSDPNTRSKYASC